MEYAAQGEERYVAAAISRAPAWVRDQVNKTRISRGLTPVLSTREYHQLAEAANVARVAAEIAESKRCGVWLDNGGRLIPATGQKAPARSKAVPVHSSRGPVVCRVLAMVAYGDAAAADVRRQLPEAIAIDAFGPAETLNRDGGWDLRNGHEGPRLQVAGPRLRAHDTTAGLVVEWLPDMSLPWCREAVEAIKSGRSAVSVSMKVVSRRLSRVPRLVELVREARLEHVALLLEEGQRPAYVGARAKVFPAVFRDDPAELRQNIDAVIERARWFNYRHGMK